MKGGGSLICTGQRFRGVARLVRQASLSGGTIAGFGISRRFPMKPIGTFALFVAILFIAITVSPAVRRTHATAFYQRKSCAEYYPVPNTLAWTNCRMIGNSACGGPPQCSCKADERLIGYKCDQGYYNECEYEHADDSGNLTRWCK